MHYYFQIIFFNPNPTITTNVIIENTITIVLITFIGSSFSCSAIYILIILNNYKLFDAVLIAWQLLHKAAKLDTSLEPPNCKSILWST